MQAAITPGSVIRSGIRRVSKSVNAVATIARQRRNARAASQVGPSCHRTRAPSATASASTSGYRQEMATPHARHRPPRTR